MCQVDAIISSTIQSPRRYHFRAETWKSNRSLPPDTLRLMYFLSVWALREATRGLVWMEGPREDVPWQYGVKGKGIGSRVSKSWVSKTAARRLLGMLTRTESVREWESTDGKGKTPFLRDTEWRQHALRCWWFFWFWFGWELNLMREM